MSNIKRSTVTLFIDSLIKIMVSELHRVKVTVDWIEDTKTRLKIHMGSSSWIMYIPEYGQVGLYLTDEHKCKLRDAVDERTNIELLQIHDRMYGGDQSSITFSEIQEMRSEKPMVEEAWQNLLTVYALNVDSEK